MAIKYPRTALLVVVALAATSSFPSSDALQATSPESLIGSLTGQGLTQVLKLGTQFFTSARPQSYAFLTALQQRRAARNDVEGAERALKLRDWLSYTGTTRGIPALFSDVFSKRGTLASVWGILLNGVSQIHVKPGENWSDALFTHQELVIQTLKNAFAKLGEGLHGGAVRELLTSVFYEIKHDHSLAQDTIAIIWHKKSSGSKEELAEAKASAKAAEKDKRQHKDSVETEDASLSGKLHAMKSIFDAVSGFAFPSGTNSQHSTKAEL